MLYYLFEFLDNNYDWPLVGLYKYVSFRAGMALVVALIVSILWGNRIISSLKSLQIGESVRDLGLDGQKEKTGTPTMGGIIIILAIIIPCLLFSKLESIYIRLLLLSTIWMGMVGAIDDYIKVFKKNKAGLEAKFKVLGQIGLGILVGGVMFWHSDIVVRVPYEEAIAKSYPITKVLELEDKENNRIVKYAYVKTGLTNVPFLKKGDMNYRNLLFFMKDNRDTFYWILFIPFIIFIIVAVSNAANLTDGIDGLAAGISAIIATTFAVIAYLSSNSQFAEYLNILYLPQSQELVIFSASLIGACIGFLWYNSFPAQVFMGDTGSLALGGIIATLAILLRKELLIPIVCGVFVIETVSVTLQVSYFKYTKKRYGEGRRIFRMSPIHHHYQKMGIPEAKIVTRFWIVGILLAILTIITLKVR
ncbi:MAG: phospho-N-acetylmuramoyl-pentapeptide-transferase [Saprospiraceae bacterium]|jgi:phospho-N-acetylmuramoyl-pentapeptide-transferase